MSSVTWAASCHPGCPNKKWLGFKTVSSRWSAPPYFNGLEFIKASTLIEVCTPSLVGPALYKDHHGWWLLIAIENTPHSGQSSAGLVYRLSDRSTLALSKTSLISLISFRERTPSRLLKSISSVQLFPLSVMSQKSKQKSRSKPQLEDYGFPPSRQTQLFEHYSQFRDDEPALEPVLGHPSPSERKQQLLDKELELVKQEKEKLALELEVLRLRQVLGPATPPATSAAPSATGKSDTKKKIIDWPQDFVPGTSINPEFNSLDLPSFVAGYLAMIRTYDMASNAHMLAILEVLMAKAISYTWASVRGFYSYLARQVELRRLDWDRITEIRDMASTFFKHSDLRSTHSRNLNSSASSSPSSGSSSQDLTAKGCQAWNYKGSCSCDSTASNYASHHLCRVCKSSVHPMLHCPKRKMPIPNQQWLA